MPVPGWLMEIVATSLPLCGRLFPDITADGLRSAMGDLWRSMNLAHCTHLIASGTDESLSGIGR